jgi:Pyruvate/2-oxoacid:ferredoxin oxidoreductase gamma subunit
VLTGALLVATGALTLEAVERALDAHLPAKARHLLDANRQALRRGAALAESIIA